MSNSGSGRYAHFSELASEPLEDPNFAAYEAIEELPWMFKTDIIAVLNKLDAKGLTICWKAPGDD